MVSWSVAYLGFQSGGGEAPKALREWDVVEGPHPEKIILFPI